MTSLLTCSPTEIIQRTEDKAHLFNIYQAQCQVTEDTVKMTNMIPVFMSSVLDYFKSFINKETAKGMEQEALYLNII